jgi:hypothetical protein
MADDEDALRTADSVSGGHSLLPARCVATTSPPKLLACVVHS